MNERSGYVGNKKEIYVTQAVWRDVLTTNATLDYVYYILNTNLIYNCNI